MKVYINTVNGNTRKLVNAHLVSETLQNIWVRLEDGTVIKRKRSRDLEKDVQ